MTESGQRRLVLADLAAVLPLVLLLALSLGSVPLPAGGVLRSALARLSLLAIFPSAFRHERALIERRFELAKVFEVPLVAYTVCDVAATVLILCLVAAMSIYITVKMVQGAAQEVAMKKKKAA